MSTTFPNKNFVEIATEEELTDFMNAHETDGCVVTFSARWCGPCKVCKPRLQGEVASRSPTPIGYVYEDDLDSSFLDVLVEIKAFPTFVFFRNGFFRNGREIERVEGVDLESLEAMIQKEGRNYNNSE